MNSLDYLLDKSPAKRAKDPPILRPKHRSFIFFRNFCSIKYASEKMLIYIEFFTNSNIVIFYLKCYVNTYPLFFKYDDV